MAAGSDEVNVKFGASIDDLKSKMDEVMGIFGKVTERFAAMAAIVAGGAAFKAFIDDANKLNGEAMKLSMSLGVTGEEAGTLNTLLGEVGSDADTYTSAFTKFNRQLRHNSDEMKALGVDVEGVKNGTKSSNEAFVEALAIGNQYAAGIDRTQVNMKLFGRSVEDVQKLQKVTNTVTADAARYLGMQRAELNEILSPSQKYAANMEAAAKKNEELNLTITKEGIAAMLEYKEAMNGVQDVLRGLGKTIGEAVIPHFTAMAEKLAAIGPTLVQAMQYLVQVLVNVWDRAGESIGHAVDVIRSAIASAFGSDGLDGMERFRSGLQGLQDALYDLFNGIDEVVTGLGDLFAVLLKAAGEVLTGLQLLVNAISGTKAETDKATESVGAFAVMGRGLAEVFRVIAVVAANVIFVLEGVGREIGAIAAQIVALARLDLKGFRAISDAVKADGVRARAELDALERRIMGVASLKAAEGSPKIEIKTGTPKGAPPGGDKKYDFGKDKSGQGEGEKAAALLALKKAQIEAELNLDHEYLQEAQAIYDDAFKENLITIRQFYDAKREIETKAIDESIAAKRTEAADAAAAEKKAQGLAASADKPADRAKHEGEALKFKTEQVKLLGQIAVLEAQRSEAVRKTGEEYKLAEQKLTDELTTMRAGREKAAADDQIAAETKVLTQKKALRQISAEDAFQIEKQLEDRSYSAAIAALDAKRATVHGDNEQAKKDREAIDIEAETAERAHQQKLGDIDRAAVLEREKYAIQAQQSIATSFSTMVSQLLNGVTKLSDVFRNFGLSIANMFVDLAAKKFTEKLFDVSGVNSAIEKMTNMMVNFIGDMVGKWFGFEAAKTAAATAGSTTRMGAQAIEKTATTTMAVTAAGVAVTAEGTKATAAVASSGVRIAADTSAGAASIASTVGSAIANIGAKAWEAAASVYASIAQIPYVGPFLAPAMAVAAGAAVLGFIGNIASSEGGEYQVDQDRLNIVHKDETILPAHFATGLRALVGDGGLSPIQTAAKQVTSVLAPGSQSATPFKGGAESIVRSVEQIVERLKPETTRSINDDAAAAPPASQSTAASPNSTLPSAAPQRANQAAAEKTWWRVPASPLAQIQSPAAPKSAGGAAPADAGSARAAGGDVHLHVQAIDGQSVKRLFMENGRALADSLKSQHRDAYMGSTT